jgi:hypothetical protein
MGNEKGVKMGEERSDDRVDEDMICPFLKKTTTDKNTWSSTEEITVVTEGFMPCLGPRCMAYCVVGDGHVKGRCRRLGA